MEVFSTWTFALYRIYWDKMHFGHHSKMFFIVLKKTIFPSSVMFLIFHIFNTRWISVTVVYFHLLIFHCKRNEYLIFLMYQCLDQYNAFHRVLPEPLSGLQYQQFLILLSLDLIQKSMGKKYQRYVLWKWYPVRKRCH